MEILTKDELSLRYKEIVDKIQKGAVFIYPTDTIYGIGCNAQNRKAVKKVRKIKERPDSPFSVWAPSVEWFKNNCKLKKSDQDWLDKLPGPYTLIANLKNQDAIVKEVIPTTKSLGVRIPDHWFGNIIRVADVPVVTTSANKASEPFMTSLEDLDPEIRAKVDFIIYEGEKKARPSKIVNLVTKKKIER